MAPHSSTLAWKVLWMEEPGRLQSMGSLRVGHDWATSLSCIGEGNGNPLQCSWLENPRDSGAWWAAICGVAQSRTRLKRLSSSSSSNQQGKRLLCMFKQRCNSLDFSHEQPRLGLPWWLSGKESFCQCRRHRFNPWSRKIPHAMGATKPVHHTY